jgi:diguanylate cyclase (GGDEF)-like protein/PAS domain S-box-containing protein
MASGPIRTLIADTDTARADALQRMLEGERSVTFQVSRTSSLDGAVGLILEAAFDAVLADLTLQDSQGLPTLAILLSYADPAPIIVLSDDADDLLCLRALQHGARDHLSRDQLYPSPVVRAIRSAVERSRTELALRESELRHRTLFQQSRDAIYMADRHGSILEVNRATLELFHRRAEELVGRPVSELFVDTAEYAHLEQEVAQSGSVREVEVRLRTGDGRELWCLVAVAGRRGVTGEILGSQGIIHDITDRKQAELRLAHDALHDSLTGLPNRTLFMDRLEQSVRRSAREPRPSFALLFLDLDRFKGVNDTLGHAAGDQVLRRTADLLSSCVRPHDTVGRLGGDEFVVLLEGIRSEREVIHVADRMLELLGQPYEVNGREFFTTASIGLTWPTERQSPPDTLLREADLSMYRAKMRGGARYEMFGPDMRQSTVSQLEVESDLRRALGRGQFTLLYQPIFSHETGRTAGFEALARWDHPGRGRLLPNVFIPLAEETGLIVPLGLWALRAAVVQLRDWSESIPGAGHLFVSINLSPRQFLEPDLVERIRAVLEEEEVAPERVRLELTESALMHDPAQAAGKLGALRDLGFDLCLDDFGTGYSSLAYLRNFPFDRLKVDRSFVGRVDHSPRDLELVATITGLSRSLGIGSIVEGVETEAQLARLRSLEPQELQGFLFSKPVDAAAAAAFIGTVRPQLRPRTPSLGDRIARGFGRVLSSR